MLRECLKGENLSTRDKEDIKWATGSLYVGGADTTVSSIHSLYLALAINPIIMEKLHAEIDSVVGESRLPVLSDKDILPYTDAVAKEVFRWNAVAPNGVAHLNTENDFYGGYLIPKNSLVIPNLEAILHDPCDYRDPYSFDPTRFLPEISGRPAERDPHTIGFGFGRRRCPGYRVAEASIFMSTAMVGAALDVKKAVMDGKAIEPKLEKMPGLVSQPKHFQISIKPRSEAALGLLQRDVE
jgi:cytochrome P450